MLIDTPEDIIGFYLCFQQTIRSLKENFVVWITMTGFAQAILEVLQCFFSFSKWKMTTGASKRLLLAFNITAHIYGIRREKLTLRSVIFHKAKWSIHAFKEIKRFRRCTLDDAEPLLNFILKKSSIPCFPLCPLYLYCCVRMTWEGNLQRWHHSF